MDNFEIVELTPQTTAVVRATVAWADLKSLFDRGFREVFTTVAAQGGQLAGAPFGYYPTTPGETVTVEVGAPVTAPITAAGDVTPGELPGGRAVHTMHVGSYDDLPRTYEAIGTWAAQQGHTLATAMWETYLDDPSAVTDPATLRTEIHWLLAD